MTSLELLYLLRGPGYFWHILQLSYIHECQKFAKKTLLGKSYRTASLMSTMFLNVPFDKHGTQLSFVLEFAL